MTPGELIDMLEARTWANQTAASGAAKRERAAKRKPRSAAERAAELKSLKESFGVKT